MKVCPKCKLEHDGSQSYCASCHNEYQKAYYRGHPQSITDSHRLRRKERRDYIVARKANKACVDCEIVYPWYVMDFDHVRGEKKFDLSRASNKMYSIETIDEEISKCDLVCANCHRERTFKRVQLDASVTGSTAAFEAVR